MLGFVCQICVEFYVDVIKATQQVNAFTYYIYILHIHLHLYISWEFWNGSLHGNSSEWEQRMCCNNNISTFHLHKLKEYSFDLALSSQEASVIESAEADTSWLYVCISEAKKMPDPTFPMMKKHLLWDFPAL